MPVCGYVVVPRRGAKAAAVETLSEIDGCAVYPAEGDDLLLLVTDTGSLEDDAVLRRRIESTPQIEALMLSFGEIDPDAPVGDPVRELER